jgi:hypothetical protein
MVESYLEAAADSITMADSLRDVGELETGTSSSMLPKEMGGMENSGMAILMDAQAWTSQGGTMVGREPGTVDGVQCC